MASNSQLSAADQAAVIAAGKAGGLKDVTVDSSGNVSASNSATKTGVNPQSGEAVGSGSSTNQNTSAAINTYGGFAALPGESQAAYYARYDNRNNTPAPVATPVTPIQSKPNIAAQDAALQKIANTNPEAADKAMDALGYTGSTASRTSSGSLAMPATGSVVDLLNSAGQDSSFAARSALAQQYGIQNYTGTAAQNNELSQKYLTAYNSAKGSAVPQNPADARNAIQGLTDDQTKQGTPTQQFYDAYASMDPVMKSVYDTMQQTLSSINTRTSLTEEISKLPEFKERADVKADLLNVKRIMDGTEDDIRDEITNSGGFATESAVQALTGARNKVLLKQANALTDQFNVLNDYVNQITDLTKADRAQVSEDLQTKLGIAKTMFDMQQTMQNSAKDNYKAIVDEVGWAGLAQSVQGNPAQTAKIENLFGMAPGELAALGTYVKPPTAEEQLKLQNLQLQNKKLTQDLNTGPAVQTQVIDVGGKKVLINSKTGAVISDISSSFAPDKSTQLAQTQQTILDTQALLKDPSLIAAVGAGSNAKGGYYPGGTPSLATATGGTSNFIAGVQQLQNQLTLQNLQNAKANGATFGALSDTELSLLASSASKISTWATKDKAGNVTGYNVDEASFKKELDKVNNFSKLDFILKGGSPASVGVQQMADGTLWSKNSDGTYVKLK